VTSILRAQIAAWNSLGGLPVRSMEGARRLRGAAVRTTLPPGSATFNYTGTGSSSQSVTGSLNLAMSGTATVPAGMVGGAAAVG
jgi:hypothetical protein